MSSIKIKIRQIILTPPIVNAVLKYDPDKVINNKVVDNGTFGLSRMESMLSCSNFEELLSSEPIQIRPAFTESGVPRGIKIDDIGYRLFTIVNGRHRVVRAMLEDMDDINVIIV
jgi:hypothetical protein